QAIGGGLVLRSERIPRTGVELCLVLSEGGAVFVPELVLECLDFSICGILLVCPILRPGRIGLFCVATLVLATFQAQWVRSPQRLPRDVGIDIRLITLERMHLQRFRTCPPL